MANATNLTERHNEIAKQPLSPSGVGMSAPLADALAAIAKTNNLAVISFVFNADCVCEEYRFGCYVHWLANDGDKSCMSGCGATAEEAIKSAITNSAAYRAQCVPAFNLELAA